MWKVYRRSKKMRASTVVFEDGSEGVFLSREMDYYEIYDTKKKEYLLEDAQFKNEIRFKTTDMDYAIIRCAELNDRDYPNPHLLQPEASP